MAQINYAQEKYLLHKNSNHEKCVNNWRKLSCLSDRRHPVKIVTTDKQSHGDWTYNAEASGKQLASPPADWSPRHDVTVGGEKKHVTGWEGPKQIGYAFKIK